MFKRWTCKISFILAAGLAAPLVFCAAARGETIRMPERGLCAHRGDQGVAPENTVAAFVAAARAGAQQVELDVQRTKDGKLVIMHDGTIDRTTTGKGAVRDLTLAEIKAVDAKLDNAIYENVKIPTFEEALDCLPRNIWINVHVKPGEGIGAEACRLVMEKDRLHQTFFAAGKKEMDRIRAICPDAKICCMERQPNPTQYIKNAIDWKCDFIQLTHDYTKDEIKRLKEAGIKINFFGTDDPVKIRKLLNDGIDFPLVNYFTKDWSVVDELGGFARNDVSSEYLASSELLQIKPKLAEKGMCAHRGDQGIAPENTIPAFVAAAKAGAQQIEFDVQLTKDGKLVVMHDLTVDRTTNGKGAIQDLTFDEIRKLDAGVKKDPKFAGTKVPTFEETLDCLPPNIILNIHIKPGSGIAAAATKVVVEKNRTPQSLISCELDKDVEEARAVCPEIAINYLSGAEGDNLKKVIQHAIDLKCEYVQFHCYDAEDMAKLKAAGVKFNFFGTDDPNKLRKLASDGVDFPLADRFSSSWKTYEKMDGYKLNPLPTNYAKSVENLTK